MLNNLIKFFDSKKVRRNFIVVVITGLILILVTTIYMAGNVFYNNKYVSDRVIKETIGEEIIYIGGRNISIGADNIKDLDIDDKLIEDDGQYRYCVVTGKIEIVNSFLKLESPFKAIYFYDKGDGDDDERGWVLNRFDLLE